MAVVYEKIVAEDLEIGTGTVTRTAPGGGTMIGTKINLSTFTDDPSEGLSASKFYLTTPVWNDIQQSAIALRDTGSNIPTIEKVGSLDIWLPNFDAIGDKLVFCHQFPHGLAEEATVTIYPHIHVITSTTSVNEVKFSLSYQWVNSSSSLSTDSSDTVSFIPYELLHNQVSFAAITGTAKRISSLFMGTLTRITNGASEYTGEVYLASFDIHHKIDTLGSDNEASKTFPS